MRKYHVSWGPRLCEYMAVFAATDEEVVRVYGGYDNVVITEGSGVAARTVWVGR